MPRYTYLPTQLSNNSFGLRTNWSYCWRDCLAPLISPHSSTPSSTTPLLSPSISVIRKTSTEFDKRFQTSTSVTHNTNRQLRPSGFATCHRGTLSGKTFGPSPRPPDAACVPSYSYTSFFGLAFLIIIYAAWDLHLLEFSPFIGLRFPVHGHSLWI